VQETFNTTTAEAVVVKLNVSIKILPEPSAWEGFSRSGKAGGRSAKKGERLNAQPSTMST